MTLELPAWGCGAVEW